MTLAQPTQFIEADDVNSVITPGYQEVEVYFDVVLGQPKMLNCYTGPSGTGKTFAVSLALERREHEVRAVYLALSGPPTRLSLMKDLALALGVDLPSRLNAHDLGIYLLDHLNPTDEDPRKLCVVIDECQQMKSTACVEVMRGLLEHHLSSFTLLFVGGDGARAVLQREPMVWTRMVAPVQFRTLTESEVLDLLPSYCPSFYEGVDPALLVSLDRERCHGVFRNWARFTVLARHTGETNGIYKLDKQLCEAVMQTQW